MKKPNLIRITNLKSKQKQQIKNMKAYLSSLVTTKWIKTRKEGKKKEKRRDRSWSESSDPTRFECTWWWGGGPVAVSGWSPRAFAMVTSLSRRFLWDDFYFFILFLFFYFIFIFFSEIKKEGVEKKQKTCVVVELFLMIIIMLIFLKEINYNLMNNKK